MKVKELVEIFNCPEEKILELLSNVGVDVSMQGDTFVEKEVEKKLARYFNVPYPFKSAKKDGKAKTSAKPKTVVPIVRAEPKKEVKPQPQPQAKQQPQPQTKQPQPQPQTKQPQPQTAVKQPQPQAKQQPQPQIKQAQQKPQPQQVKTSATKTPSSPTPQPKSQPEKQVVSKPKASKPLYFDDEPVVPRIDEEMLSKYGEFLDDDEYNIKREVRIKKKDTDSEGSLTKKRRGLVKKPVPKKGKHALHLETPVEENVVYYEAGMTVIEVAEALNTSVTNLVKKLFVSIGVMASATSVLDRDTIELIAMEYGYEVKDKKITDLVRFDEMEIIDESDQLVPRPPVVTIMGHVDHGKTTLLDTIRSSHVVKGEAGGITQHIGAYQVEKNGRLVTFIDTPGHAAFTEMRARGASITDIVILVVAADDGLMPQTVEAIEHAQAAKVPIIVAVNKMDRPQANPERIKQQLTEYNLVAEEWGGDTIIVPISALTGQGVDELLEMVLLVSDMKDLKANPNRLGVGTVIEAKLDKGRGPVATLLVQNGSIKVGDVIVVGNTYGKIRAMYDENGRPVTIAGPSKPVEITGIEEVPFAGERFMIYNDERKAREIASIRAQNKFNEEKGVGKSISLAELMKSQKNEEVKELNLIIRCDVQGSIEAIRGLLEKINIEGTKINIVASRVGAITESDVNLAIASNSIIIGFNIRPQAAITEYAKSKGIEIRLYDIIYKLQEDIEMAVKGLLDPVMTEKILGEAEVRETFKASKIGTIAGCYVTSGLVQRNASVRLIRNSIVIYTGKISSLKRFKDDVREVKAGYECGLTIENYNDIKVGDFIECFIMEEEGRE
ncbi:MAG TPA: translation initiation factor IF-2 [Bacilli bacterium]|jgi:translation initiation factor IF-2|nr:translation initiation factor IF-2 [Bacilli bacterium]HON64005.1 translation initiation factor IF-2 [Bacilli bacterium]HPD11763.1 translation initiation factor IF-2 [Bacilli bacterium]HPK57904.1 translation initiation factor IF-2 [Bacilli bacterium]HRS30569.1 translation initiation factor IF-2 [Bacilli bacterium]